ncbi:hypothetical protein [Piscinibacter sp.]|jgi:hypothetical protein|uniref:hypothetical protein n=1 Tax=Piscinibacter sp. TaxID=1903157 RepID=UPI001DD3D6F7|nr:hypothetical protein [Piscinibacter sp.]MBK7531934.1 hypothetical protein [Piscinibacter sp.]
MKHLAITLLLGLAAATAGGQTRFVVVNGQRLSDAQVAQFARLNCSVVPDGRYWLNPASGAWGYAGGPQQGRVGDGCRNRDGTEGPFATLRRAEEVANGYRGRGQHAVAFHNGDGYYVRVAR